MKQEEIREGIALLIPTDCDNCYLDGSKEIRSDCDDLEEPGSPCLLQLFLAKEYLSYLHSQGVVIKVDRESAICGCCRGTGLIGGAGINDCCPECNGTGKIFCVGYKAVGPLVKDENK